MLTSIDVKFIFDSAHLGFVQPRKYSPNRRCCPSSCLLPVLAMFFIFAKFLLLKRVKCPPFLFSQPKQLNLVPRSSRLRVP